MLKFPAMAANAADDNKKYTFSDFTLDTARGVLVKDGEEVELRPQSYEVLRILVSRAGELVMREELQQAVWGHKVVTDDSLSHCMTDVRKALSDDEKTIIRTVPRRGFIFDVPVETEHARDSAPPIADDTPRQSRLGWGVAATVAVLTAVFFVVSNDDPEIAEPAEKTIAVLPFANFSEEASQVYFSDGLTEEILNSLAKTPDLLVTARTSSFAYRDSTEDVPTIATALGVRHILEGSVRRSGDRLRVTAQLIRAKDGFHVWSDTFDSTDTDIITIQENIAIAIANALETVMDPEELERMIRVGTRSVPAYEAYLAGNGTWLAAANDIYLRLEAQKWFEKAVEHDPEFTIAYDRLFWHWQLQLPVNNIAYRISGLPYEEILAKRDEALDNAIRTERDESTLLKYQAHKAWVDMHPDRALRLMDEFHAQNPTVGTGRALRVILLNILGQQEELDRTVVQRYDSDDLRRGQAGRWLDALEFSENRELMLKVAHDAIAQYGHVPTILYRAHHVLLNAGDIDGAAAILPDITNNGSRSTWPYLAGLRQACAESRIEDAERIYSEALAEHPDNLSLNWLARKIMGHDEEAAELFRVYDDRREFVTMYGFLDYPNFDPKLYPNFMQAVSGRGIRERPIKELVYRCDRK